FVQAEDGIRHFHVTGVQTCALPILATPWISSMATPWISSAPWGARSVVMVRPRPHKPPLGSPGKSDQLGQLRDRPQGFNLGQGLLQAQARPEEQPVGLL